MLKSFLLLTALIIPVSAQNTPTPAARSKEKPTRPNIVFILADDLGYGELGCYGQKKIKTPHVDQLAKEGVKLTQHYSGAPVCAPSRVVLMTGKNLAHSEIRGNKNPPNGRKFSGQWPLAADTLTIAEVLKEAGYATGSFGKWGLGLANTSGSPIKQGFDRFYGYNCQKNAHSYYPPYLDSDETEVQINKNPIPGHVRKAKGEIKASDYRAENYAPDLILEESLKFIDKNKDKPFFLYLPFVEPHVAMQPGNEWIDRYPKEWDDPKSGGKGVYRGQNGYLPHDRPRAAYAAMISDMDEHVGAILARLKKHGLDKNTIVVFTSDNGATHRAGDRRFNVGGVDTDFFDSSAGLRGFKGSCYEGGLRVPCVIKWPGKIKAGTLNHEPSYFADWLTTLASVARASHDPSLTDGVDLTAIFKGKPLPERKEEMIWEFCQYGGIVAIRHGKWKAVRRNLLKKKPAPWELYNIDADSVEKNNIAKRHPEIVQKLEKAWLETRVVESDFPIPLVDRKKNQESSQYSPNNILPRPQHLQIEPGHFNFNAATGVEVRGEQAKSLALHLKEVFKRNKWKQTTAGPRIIIEHSASSKMEASAYQLHVSKDSIHLKAGDKAGLFYALQSLRQLLPVQMETAQVKGSIKIKCVTISDKPRFAYRGMLLDSGRQFHTVDFVKRFIDQLAMMKMNTLHWHLTEADGWRIEIKKYPKLTQIGSNVAIRHPQQKGFYTQEQIKDIVKYALARHVTIIPEIDIPGHSAAALESYPFLSCTGKAPDRKKLEKKGEGWKHHEIICGGQASARKFCRDVLSEVVELFPSPYIHIGGDEAQKSKWNKCPHCQQAIADKKLKNAHELQVDMTIELADFLHSKGRKTLCWGDVVTHPGQALPKHVAVQWWNFRGHKFKAPNRAFTNGHDLFCSPNWHTYLNFQVHPWKGYKQNRTFDLKTAYNDNNIDKVKVPAGKEHLMKGLVGAIWCDYGVQQEDIDKRLFPRVYALAELGWHVGAKEDFQPFYNKVKAQYPRLKALGIDYGPAMAE